MGEIRIESFDDNRVIKIPYNSNGENTFRILFGGNLDLYFSIYNNNGLTNKEFIIDKSNYYIYSLFEILYDEIINCQIYTHNLIEFNHIIGDRISVKEYNDRIEFLKEMNEDVKNRYFYKSLVHDQIITWKSDDYADEVATFFSIIKKEDIYIIKFDCPEITKDIRNKYLLCDIPSEIDFEISVRIRNSGSKYNPFNVPFMQLFQKIWNDSYDYDQIHIEEYLFEEAHKKRNLRKN